MIDADRPIREPVVVAAERDGDTIRLHLESASASEVLVITLDQSRSLAAALARLAATKEEDALKIEWTLTGIAAAMAVLVALASISLRMQYDTARAVAAIERESRLGQQADKIRELRSDARKAKADAAAQQPAESVAKE
ncbi:MAG: hypothetical protein HQL39_15150 [Alphaproteobacteria bacterium]|nr:hypothetical protein [Alphaproteobacteria bacterium]